MDNKRFFYTEVLRDILSEKCSMNTIKNNIDESDRAFFNMLFMTTFRNLTFIKKEVLSLFVKKKIPSKQSILKYILYLGAVEILFLEKPVYAVIDSYVEIAKKKTDKYGANFVNAVLRNIARNKEDIIKNRKTKYFSDDFIKLLKTDYSKAEIAEIEIFANIEPKLDLTFKIEKTPKNIEYIELPWGSYRLKSDVKVSSIEGFHEGDFWVQDASSSMAVNVLDMDLENKKILDLCAAPGGKTAQLLARGAIVDAVDVSAERLKTLRENIKRLKLGDKLNITCCDALEFCSKEKFDIVLVDAPCSATGTFRRHPEIIHTRTVEDVKKMSLIQKKILEKASSLVKPLGMMVYATCSLSKQEGEFQILEFLDKNKDFEITPINNDKLGNIITKEGFLRILPQHLKDFSGTDGFFVACLQRKN
ncbi:MAG: RsmD family RNA methyltransferase [Alphaproteobacteria bacterium]|nr:RsmD family RNA methyltransferase [Alphaproteobacteria bacterium]